MAANRAGVWGVGFLIGAAVFGVQQFAYEIPKESAIFGKQGKVADGTVVSKRRAGTYRSRKYYVKVSYVDDAQRSQQGECSVSSGEYDDIEQGTPVQVRYHPADPSYLMLVGSSKDHPPSPMLAGTITGVLALLGVGALVISRRE